MSDSRAFQVRLAPDTWDRLKAYKLITGVAANDLIGRLLADFLEGPGRAEIEAGLPAFTRGLYAAEMPPRTEAGPCYGPDCDHVSHRRPGQT